MSRNVKAPERCYDCEYYYINRELEYYNYPECLKSGKEITLGLLREENRPKWCLLAVENNVHESVKDAC